MSTSQHTHAINALDVFIKEASAATKALTVGAVGKDSANRKRTAAGQQYSNPVPSVSSTQPSLVATQKVTPPPAV